MTNKRVLIPTDDNTFLPDLVKSYNNLGYEATVGSMNFHLCVGSYDIVNIIWPEYLCSSFPPSDDEINDIEKKLQWWRQRSRIIITVENFYPHAYEHHHAYKKLYYLFYSASSGIIHHSKTSVEWVCKEFPVAATKPNIVTTPLNYPSIVRDEFDRNALRSDFDLKEDDFVILAFGRLRKWREAHLVLKAYSKTNIIGKRLLLGCRFKPLRTSMLFQKFQKILWYSWIKIHQIPHSNGLIPDDDVYKYFGASDVVIIPRINDLNSGILCLGMAFGKIIIASETGSNPDNLEGTENLLYKPGDAKSLASALEKAAVLDRERIGQKNREIAKTWGTDNLARECIKIIQNIESQV